MQKKRFIPTAERLPTVSPAKAPAISTVVSSRVTLAPSAVDFVDGVLQAIQQAASRLAYVREALFNQVSSYGAVSAQELSENNGSGILGQPVAARPLGNLLKWIVASVILILLIWRDTAQENRTILPSSTHQSANLSQTAATLADGFEGYAKGYGQKISIQRYRSSIERSDEDLEHERRAQLDSVAQKAYNDQMRVRKIAREIEEEDRNAAPETVLFRTDEDYATSFLQDHYFFQSNARGTRFMGLDFDMLDGLNVTRVSYHLYRFIKSENIKTMFDYPCSLNAKWMPSLLTLLDFEVRGFRYYCGDDDPKAIESFKLNFKGAALPSFVLVRGPQYSSIPWNMDLVFSLYGLQRYQKEHGIQYAWGFIKAIRKTNAKWMILGNSQGGENLDPGIINLKNMPFNFAEAGKVVRNITDELERGVAHPLQLLFYRVGQERRTGALRDFDDARTSKILTESVQEEV